MGPSFRGEGDEEKLAKETKKEWPLTQKRNCEKVASLKPGDDEEGEIRTIRRHCWVKQGANGTRAIGVSSEEVTHDSGGCLIGMMGTKARLELVIEQEERNWKQKWGGNWRGMKFKGFFSSSTRVVAMCFYPHENDPGLGKSG